MPLPPGSSGVARGHGYGYGYGQRPEPGSGLGSEPGSGSWMPTSEGSKNLSAFSVPVQTGGIRTVHGKELRNGEPYMDSLLKPKQQTMLSHDGTSFQILNPRDSLQFARVVSYVEDMDFPYGEAERAPRMRDAGGVAEDDSYSIYDEPHNYNLPSLLQTCPEDDQIDSTREERPASLADKRDTTTVQRVPTLPAGPEEFNGGENKHWTLEDRPRSRRDVQPPSRPPPPPSRSPPGPPPPDRDPLVPALFNYTPDSSLCAPAANSDGQMGDTYSFRPLNRTESMPFVVTEGAGRKLKKQRPVSAPQKEKKKKRYSILRPFQRLYKAFS